MLRIESGKWRGGIALGPSEQSPGLTTGPQEARRNVPVTPEPQVSPGPLLVYDHAFGDLMAVWGDSGPGLCPDTWVQWTTTFAFCDAWASQM